MTAQGNAQSALCGMLWGIVAIVVAVTISLVWPTKAAAPVAIEGTTSQRTNMSSTSGTPLMTLTTQGPATVNSTVQGGFGRNLSCVYNQTAHTGSSAVTVNIQGVVPPGTTPVGYTILASASIAATDGVTVLTVGPGVTAASNAAVQMVVPALWRVQAVESGGGSTVTATINCTTSE
jgi:hypothetical protein